MQNNKVGYLHYEMTTSIVHSREWCATQNFCSLSNLLLLLSMGNAWPHQVHFTNIITHIFSIQQQAHSICTWLYWCPAYCVVTNNSEPLYNCTTKKHVWRQVPSHANDHISNKHPAECIRKNMLRGRHIITIVVQALVP